MKSLSVPWTSGMVRPAAAIAASAVVCLAFVFVGCSNDAPGQTGCDAHTDCELGYACSEEGECLQTSCDNCPNSDELICYKTEERPEGTCSAPECEEAADCDEPGAICEEGVCKPGCSSNSDCGDGERCNAFGVCVEGGGADSDTGLTDVGDTGTTDASGDDVTVDGESADGDTSDVAGCSEVKSCPRPGNEDADKWSSDFCACVECHGESDCSDGEECRGGICRPVCAQEDQCSGSGECSGSNPYCISDCCVECVGAMDCSDNDVCVDGSCTEGPDDCTADPSQCPENYSCNSDTGKCEKDSSGEECSEENPCPSGEYCNQETNECETPSGGGDCGRCESGCTCPGQSTCNDFACVGCEVNLLDPSKDCPEGQVCLPPLTEGGESFCF